MAAPPGCVNAGEREECRYLLAFGAAGGENGAGEGNRTLVVSLEGFCSTIELHPQPIENT